MRFRWILSTVCVCLLTVLAGVLIVQAQTQGLNERNALWESRAVIGTPGDDDDEADDECDDSMALVAQTGQTGCWDFYGTSIDCAGTGQERRPLLIYALNRERAMCGRS